MSNSKRAKLLQRPWSRRDVIKEKKAQEKRTEIVEKFRQREKTKKENKKTIS
jgi:hypothetical protein